MTTEFKQSHLDLVLDACEERGLEIENIQQHNENNSSVILSDDLVLCLILSKLNSYKKYYYSIHHKGKIITNYNINLKETLNTILKLKILHCRSHGPN